MPWLVLSAKFRVPIEHQTYAWLVGVGIRGDGIGVILAVGGAGGGVGGWMARLYPRNRSMPLAIATAAGSAGQVFGGTVGLNGLLGFLMLAGDIPRLCRARSWRCF